MTTRNPEPALNEAWRRDPGNEFVVALNTCFKTKGFLSAKQIAALDRVSSTRAFRVAHVLGYAMGMDADGTVAPASDCPGGDWE